MTATTMLAMIPRIVRRIQPLRPGRQARALVSLLFLAAALFLAIPANGLSAAQPACPYTATAAVDGCAGAPTGSALTVLRPEFFSGYAQRGKQRWISAA